jgi:hypothetical protein
MRASLAFIVSLREVSKRKQSFYIFWHSPFKEFGGTFLSRFEGSETDSEVLKSLTIVDTPGILGKYMKKKT